MLDFIFTLLLVVGCFVVIVVATTLCVMIFTGLIDAMESIFDYVYDKFKGK